jgi:hypothetical protein
MTKKMDISRMSDDDLQDMFTEVYGSKVASINNIDSFECICKRVPGAEGAEMEVLVVGMAGSPTMNDYKSNKVIDSSSVVIEREDRGILKFKLVPEKIVALNTNDYQVIYKSI